MILYYDCFSGISGDMNLAAMLDLGVPEEYLRKELSKLSIDGYSLEVSRGMKNGISGTKVKVRLDQGAEHHHRNLQIITDIIEGSALNERVRQNSIHMFTKLAEAEAKVHDKTIEEVHFHEVGAVDSIVDIVGAAICFDYLQPEKIVSSAIELGSGLVKCEHGTFPVPAPATAEILKGIPVKTGNQPFEATTPTGAVVLAANVDEFLEKSELVIHKMAYGLGHKESDVPNVLRVFSADMGDPADQETQHSMFECNIDDMNPEMLEFIMDKLFDAGADDVFITPVIMKKSRNASKLSVLCRDALKDKVAEILFRETSTLGVRCNAVDKTELERTFNELKTPYGSVRIKNGFYKGELIKQKAEYEDVAKIAREKDIPIRDIYREIERILEEGM